MSTNPHPDTLPVAGGTLCSILGLQTQPWCSRCRVCMAVDHRDPDPRQGGALPGAQPQSTDTSRSEGAPCCACLVARRHCVQFPRQTGQGVLVSGVQAEPSLLSWGHSWERLRSGLGGDRRKMGDSVGVESTHGAPRVTHSLLCKVTGLFGNHRATWEAEPARWRVLCRGCPAGRGGWGYHHVFPGNRCNRSCEKQYGSQLCAQGDCGDTCRRTAEIWES